MGNVARTQPAGNGASAGENDPKEEENKARSGAAVEKIGPIGKPLARGGVGGRLKQTVKNRRKRRVVQARFCLQSLGGTLWPNKPETPAKVGTKSLAGASGLYCLPNWASLIFSPHSPAPACRLSSSGRSPTAGRASPNPDSERRPRSYYCDQASWRRHAPSGCRG